MPTIPELPQDIINSILSELHDDKPTLKHCALVAWSFRTESQRHVYGTISINLSREAQHIARLHDLHGIVKNNAMLLTHVRCLHLYIPAIDEKNTEVLAILPMLRQIRKLDSHVSGRDTAIYWYHLTEALREHLYLLMQSPDLVDIGLCSVSQIPLSCFTRCRQLQSVTLSWVSFSLEDTKPLIPTPPSHGSGELIFLRVCTPCGILNLLDAMSHSDCPLTIRHLSELDISLNHKEDVPPCQTILNMCAESLESFTVSLDGYYMFDNDEVFALDLSKMRSLRLLSMDFTRWSPSAFFSWLPIFVSKYLPADGRLERLMLTGPGLSEDQRRSMSSVLAGGTRLLAVQVEFTCWEYQGHSVIVTPTE
ncbi:hypothetical protein Hypma_007065 [Hypsizygus marmoreus]|uniref:F-box domain-containing protein n=1 Tax=Hypsizygus marmoreus TaxID=39966 RepID=A0A369K7C6_HYPMA|nr:hypothetical protein Hypma_007065 [Hypsizygus marmoreus]